MILSNKKRLNCFQDNGIVRTIKKFIECNDSLF
jgi:hypothetical protein